MKSHGAATVANHHRNGLPSPSPSPPEADSLRQRVALEQARVGELEGLLAIARADQVGRVGGAKEGLETS